MSPVPEPALWPPDLHLVFHADPVSVRHALTQMLALPPLAGLSANARGIAELVLAEVLNNVVEHAYSDGGGAVAVTLVLDVAGIRCLIVDEGRAMPEGRLPMGSLPETAQTSMEDLPEGGFGWHLIRTLCADLTYTRSTGQNRLAFVLPTGGRDLRNAT